MTRSVDSQCGETGGSPAAPRCPSGHRLDELAAALGARVLTHPGRAAVVRVASFAAASHVSDLLAQAGAATLLVSELESPHLVRIAELLDVPAICVAGAGEPAADLVAAARAAGKVLLVVPGAAAALARRLTGLGVARAEEDPA